MIAVALKGLAARKVRALLTALAVVIGISMVSGTYILTDTMQKSFDGLFTATYDKTDAVISGKEIVKGQNDGASDLPTIPAAMLDEVRRLPQVEAASGVVSPDEVNTADILGEDGDPVARESVAGSIDLEHPEFSPLKLKSGEWAKGPDQVVVDAGTVEKQGYELGDEITISMLGTKHTFELAGVVRYGDVDSLGFASIAAWDLETAQQLLHREGRFDSISIGASDGTSSAELVRAVAPLVPASLQVKDSAKQAEEDADELNSSMSILKYFLLGFGGVALLVGAFVIFNTLSITVAQRTREFATLRTLGGSRRQVMRSVVAEGFAIGLIASVLGLLAGIGLAKGMVALFSALGVDLPEAATIVAPRTVILSILVGTVVTLVASILPARRATRVPPIAAVREGSTLPPSRLAAHSLKAGLTITGASLAAVLAGVFAGGLSGAATGLLLGLGVLGLFAGMAVLAPRLVTPLARIVGWPAKRAGGVAGELAGANAIRNPGRTASTAAALMIGLTLVTIVAVLAASLTQGTQDSIRKDVHADYVIDGKDGLAFRAAEGDGLEAIAGVDVRVPRPLRHRPRRRQGDRRSPGSIPTRSAGSSRSAGRRARTGSLQALGTDGAIVTKKYADDKHLGVGDELAITAPSGEKADVVVRGIHEPEAEPADRHQHRPEGLRRAHHPVAEHAHVPRRRRGCRQGDRVEGGRLQRRDVPHRGGLREGLHEGRGDDARDALRAAGLLRARQPVRHGQHARALGVRAHPRDRHAAHDRHDPPPGAQDDPPREHHHGADRRRARAGHRHRARDARHGQVAHADGDPDPDAARVHAGRGRGGHRRRRHAGPARVSAQRAGGTALRVARSKMAVRPVPPWAGRVVRPPPRCHACSTVRLDAFDADGIVGASPWAVLDATTSWWR